jgi:hypothetical protein
VALGTLGSLVAGCTATIAALKHKDLDVQTRISASIFLDPTVVAKKTVWLEIQSTADEPMELAARREATS